MTPRRSAIWLGILVVLAIFMPRAAIADGTPASTASSSSLGEGGVYPPGMFAPVTSHPNVPSVDTSALLPSRLVAVQPAVLMPPRGAIPDSHAAWLTYLGNCRIAQTNFKLAVNGSRRAVDQYSRAGMATGAAVGAIIIAGVLFIWARFRKPNRFIATVLVMGFWLGGGYLGSQIARQHAEERQVREACGIRAAAMDVAWSVYVQELRDRGFDVR